MVKCQQFTMSLDAASSFSRTDALFLRLKRRCVRDDVDPSLGAGTAISSAIVIFMSTVLAWLSTHTTVSSVLNSILLEYITTIDFFNPQLLNVDAYRAELHVSLGHEFDLIDKWRTVCPEEQTHELGLKAALLAEADLGPKQALEVFLVTCRLIVT
jgi:hypothetical protein